MPSTTVITTCTRDCPSCCGLTARVENGRLTALTGNPAHPLNRGGRCAKMQGYPARVYSPERATHPLRRNGSSWQRISWQDALDEWADRMQDIVAASGPEAILHYQGYGERTALKLLNARFFAHLGGVTTPEGTLCSGTAYAAMCQDFGTRQSHDPLDHCNSGMVILWGRNPAATQFALLPVLAQVRKKGGRVWLVDPAATESLSVCDRHIQLRPGGDLYLALGAAKVVLTNGWEDRDFIASHTNNFAAFQALVEQRSLEELAALAGVSVADCLDLARAMVQGRQTSQSQPGLIEGDGPSGVAGLLGEPGASGEAGTTGPSGVTGATGGPTAILLGWGMHRHVDAHLGVRAIDALSAITGNIGLPGGGVSQGFEEYGPYEQSLWGQDLHPPRRTLLMPRIGREILAAEHPAIRMIVSSAANPVCMAPNAKLVEEAFRRTEFVVHMGHFLDDTADTASLFLPCTTFLEENDIVASYGHNWVGPVNQAIEPVGECRSQFAIYQDLAGRFPFAKQYCAPEAQWLERICRPLLDLGIPLEALRAGPVRHPEAPMAAWTDKAFATPSGRFEFLGGLTASGETGTPQDVTAPAPQGRTPAHGPTHSLAPTAAYDPAYPLTLLTTGSPEHLCSELTLEEHSPRPVAVVHPEAAPGMGDGDTAWLATSLGRILVTLRLDPRQRPDVCLCRRGGWAKAGHGLNRLIPDAVSALGNGTPYYEARAALSAVDTGALPV